MSQSRQRIRFCASADGTRIAYATCGSGPPLVWVQLWTHHLEFDWDSPVWGPWLSMLALHHTLVRYDWRGCGLSDRERVQFSFDKYVEDLEAVIAAAGLERFVLIGMSGSGSAVAMRYVSYPSGTGHPSRPLWLQYPWSAGRQSNYRATGGGASTAQGLRARLAKRKSRLRSVLCRDAHPGCIDGAVSLLQ